MAICLVLQCGRSEEEEKDKMSKKWEQKRRNVVNLLVLEAVEKERAARNIRKVERNERRDIVHGET